MWLTRRGGTSSAFWTISFYYIRFFFPLPHGYTLSHMLAHDGIVLHPVLRLDPAARSSRPEVNTGGARASRETFTNIGYAPRSTFTSSIYIFDMRFRHDRRVEKRLWGFQSRIRSSGDVYLLLDIHDHEFGNMEASLLRRLSHHGERGWWGGGRGLLWRSGGVALHGVVGLLGETSITRRVLYYPGRHGWKTRRGRASSGFGPWLAWEVS